MQRGPEDLERARRDGYRAGRASVHFARGWASATGPEILAWRDGHREGYAIYTDTQRGGQTERMVQAQARLEQVQERRDKYLRAKSA